MTPSPCCSTSATQTTPAAPVRPNSVAAMRAPGVDQPVLLELASWDGLEERSIRQRTIHEKWRERRRRQVPVTLLEDNLMALCRTPSARGVGYVLRRSKGPG
jgi:hypothetical protein